MILVSQGFSPRRVASLYHQKEKPLKGGPRRARPPGLSGFGRYGARSPQAGYAVAPCPVPGFFFGGPWRAPGRVSGLGGCRLWGSCRVCFSCSGWLVVVVGSCRLVRSSVSGWSGFGCSGLVGVVVVVAGGFVVVVLGLVRVCVVVCCLGVALVVGVAG